jgi:hypothetical protein
MNHEIQFKTGNSTLSGCRNVSMLTNHVPVFSSDFAILDNLISGKNMSRVSLNSQTLCEADFSTISLPFVSFKDTSGDYFVDESISKKKAFFSNDLGLSDFSEISFLYEKRNSGNFAIYSSTGYSTFNTGIEAAIAAKIPAKTGQLSDLEFYLNGQKLYSGDSYTITGSNNRFNYIQTITGKMFAVEKDSLINNRLSEDIYGTGFIEGNSNFYLNGLEQHPDSWLEIHTGVSLVKTGVSSFLPIEDYSFSEVRL